MFVAVQKFVFWLSNLRVHIHKLLWQFNNVKEIESFS